MSRTWTDGDLVEAARTSFNRIEMMRKIGLTPRGRTYGSLKPHIERLNIDLSHMKPGGIRVDPNLVFMNRSTVSPSTVRRMILKSGIIPYLCKKCGNTGSHLGIPLTLQLDHENGDCKDHRIDNLRWLCPNCHSQTETYSRDTRGTRRSNSSRQVVILECHYCRKGFERPKRNTYLKEGYRCFCTRKCSVEFRKKNCPKNKKHEEIYETFLKIRTFLGTAKRHGISGNMVRKIVNKYERSVA